MLGVAQEKQPKENTYRGAVSATTQYIADQSDETAGRYVFAYTITIRNTGAVAAQLISRHWIITDAQGLVQEVRGLGVVGAQPATSRIKATQRMWIIYLEVALALAIAAFIVWFTWPRNRK